MSFMRFRNRLVVIAMLVTGSALSLWNNYRVTTGPDHPGRPVNLGLDLQGGMHLALELDQSEHESADPDRDLDLALAVLRKRMDEFGVSERLIQRTGSNRIVVELPGVRDAERAREIVRRAAFLELRLTDESRALDQVLAVGDRLQANERARGDGEAAARLSSLVRPSSDLGYPHVPGEYATPDASWRTVDSLLRLPEVERLLPRRVELRWASTADGGTRLLYALQRPVVTGSSLIDARARLDPATNAPEVDFTLDRAGGRLFAAATARHVGSHLAILLDNRVQGRPPVIQSRIERQGRIQMGGRSLADAQVLALTLRAGALPAPLSIVEERQIGPSLGHDSIESGITAGLAGSALVVAIMVGYYSTSGVLAVIALALYVLFCLGTLAMFGAALTLPGLAGFILSLGMAVDANVLIFERIREELDSGRTASAALRDGFRHAMPAIVDSNLTTVLTALFLYQFGTGPVKGFAVTMVVGIVASMVTAVFVTRTLFQLWLRRKEGAAAPSIGSRRWLTGAAFDFPGSRRRAYLATAMVLAVGLGFLAQRGVRYGVDFTGGTLHQIEIDHPVDPARIRTALAAQRVAGAEVQQFGGPRSIVVRSARADASDGAIAAAFDDAAGPSRYEVVRTETVGPKVGGELRAQATTAVALSFVAVLAYLAYRFEWRYGIAAVVATAHDILVTIAFIVTFDLEITLLVVAALLTVVGYSLNDTIVIFDRVRERVGVERGAAFEGQLNRAVNETLPRTLLTGGTAAATLAALAIFGGAVVRPFAVVMLFGIVAGTFSSIFIASPVLAFVHRRWPPAARPASLRPGPHTAP